jgi:hypothetical protein
VVRVEVGERRGIEAEGGREEKEQWIGMVMGMYE